MNNSAGDSSESGSDSESDSESENEPVHTPANTLSVPDDMATKDHDASPPDTDDISDSELEDDFLMVLDSIAMLLLPTPHSLSLLLSSIS